MSKPKLLRKNAKLAKDAGVYTLFGLSLAPASMSGKNLCPNSSAGCRAACIFTSGRGMQSNVIESRLAKAHRFLNDREAFLNDLAQEIDAMRKTAKRKGEKLAVRLNVFSDVPWENVLWNGANLMTAFPDVQFYDYTKSKARAIRFAKGQMPANYHLTFSRSECNDDAVAEVMAAGGNVAVVFADKLPKRWMGRKVVNGDIYDARFLDPAKSVIGLKVKGQGKKDHTGFVL